MVLGRLLAAVGAEVEDFVKQVKSFDSDAGPGPSGLRPQFIKDLVGEAGDDPSHACKQCSRVPKFLSRWFAGGTLVGNGKDDQPIDEEGNGEEQY